MFEIVLLPIEVSDSLLYLKWHFLFQGTLMQVLLSLLYEKGCLDHHCFHGSHNAKKTLHRLGLCCCSHHLDHVQTLRVDKCLRNSEHLNGLMFPAVSGRKAIFVYMRRWRQDLSGFWLLPLEWRWRHLSGNTMCGQWKIMGQLEGEITSVWWEVGNS